MPLPEDFYDDDVNYAMRVCIAVADGPIIGLITGSKVYACDDCGQAIWFDENQTNPPFPDGMVVKGVIALCTSCARRAVANAPEEPIIPNESPVERALTRKILGLGDENP